MMTGNVVAIVAGGVICALVSYFTFDANEVTMRRVCINKTSIHATISLSFIAKSKCIILLKAT